MRPNLYADIYVICGKYVEDRGVDLYNEVCVRNLEGVVAKRKTGTYATVSGWLKIKNPNYTQSERRHELFESFKAKQTTRQPSRTSKSRLLGRELWERLSSQPRKHCEPVSLRLKQQTIQGNRIRRAAVI